MIVIASIQVFPLFLYDLGQMGLRYLAHLLLIRNARALRNAGLDLQQCRRGGTLALELKRAVAIDRHDHRNRNSVELARPLIELRDELPEVDAEFAERSSHR